MLFAIFFDYRDERNGGEGLNRRRFLTTSLTAAAQGGALAPGTSAQTPPKAAPEYYELRQFTCGVTMRQLLGPLQGRGPAGVQRAGIVNRRIHGSLRARQPTFWGCCTTRTSIGRRGRCQTPGRPQYKFPFLRLRLPTPATSHRLAIDVAFDGIPVLEKPTGALAGPSRVFELRTYESHTRPRTAKKTEMFNKGEIDIFRRTRSSAGVLRLEHHRHAVAEPDVSIVFETWQPGKNCRSS